MKGFMKAFALLAVVAWFSLSPSVSVPAQAAETVTLVDFSWDSVQFHNRVAGFILEHGFGLKPDYLFSESIPGLMGLERGDVHVAMEVWVDNVLEWYEASQEKKTAIALGETFPDAPQGWYVPTYVIEGDPERGIEPMAPDFRSVEDIARYKELFRDPEEPDKARLYNGPTGWQVHSINVKKIEAYGLKDDLLSFDPGSQTALATAIVSAYEKGEPILAYYWEPTPIMGELDMTLIEEPAYDPQTWESTAGCAFPASRVWKMVNAAWASEHPDVLPFLEAYVTTLDETNAALAYMKTENTDAGEAAKWFLREYGHLWKAWVGDAKRVSAIEQALAR